MSTLSEFTIIVVDDNEFNRLICKQMIQAVGYTCTVVDSGEEAVSLVEEKDCRIVFMDIEMPGMDGVEATEKIRSLEGVGSKVRIIALTAHNTKESRERFLAAGMNDVLVKPVEVAKFKAHIEEYLPCP